MLAASLLKSPRGDVERFGLVVLDSQARMFPSTREAFSHAVGKAGLEDNIPEPAGDPVSALHSSRAVVIEMVAFDVPEVGVTKVIEVYAVMNPLFGQIALNDTGEQHRRCVKGKDKAQGCGDHKERKQVCYHPVDVQAIGGPLVMLPMKRVEALVSKVLVPLLVPHFRFLKPTVKDIAVREILHQSPDRDSCQEEDHSQVRVRRAPRQRQQDDGINGIKGGDGIESPPGNGRLPALVKAERIVGRASVRTHNHSLQDSNIQDDCQEVPSEKWCDKGKGIKEWTCSSF